MTSIARSIKPSSRSTPNETAIRGTTSTWLLSLHRADQKRFVTGQLARATRPALASRGRRSALPLALHQLEGEAVADLEVAGCCPAGMAGLNKGRHPHAQIQGVAVGHNPPPVSRRESQFGPGRNLSNPPFGPTL